MEGNKTACNGIEMFLFQKSIVRFQMDQENFDKLLGRRLEKINSVLKSKAKEYAKGDRLHNFKVAAMLAQSPITPEQALLGMLRKHLVSVIDIIEDTGNGIVASRAMVDEKVGDTINYMILLEALLVEREETGRLSSCQE